MPLLTRIETATSNAGRFDVDYASSMLWLLLAGGVARTRLRRFSRCRWTKRARHIAGTLRNAIRLCRARSRFYERVRAKTLTGAELDLLTARLVQMEQQRRQLGETIQRYQVALTRRGFGVNHFWLPTIEQFEKEALAQQSATTDGSKAT